jgi:tripartite-type tricarboxylate transporter receptor subunit TctC
VPLRGVSGDPRGGQACGKETEERMKRFFIGLICLISFSSYSQEYPNKPIRILVPFAPGGAVDTASRVLAQAMQQRLNWQFVVENRPGGNGFIDTTAAAKSAPDGYTLLMAHTGEFAVNPAIFDNVPYDLERDFVAITW